VRLFFAVWPDERASGQLARLAEEVAVKSGGRAVPGANIHLTLAFLGDVAESRIPELEAIARRIHVPAFPMRLDRLGSFRKAQVAWVGAETPPPGLVALESALAAGLREAGFSLDDRPYAPHVTLDRHARTRIAGEAGPVEWRAGAFELVRTEFGKGRYSRLAAFALD
jgi:2'-5' RNA ligase